MRLIEAAKEFGIRPSALILGADSRKPWGKWDILLANAYSIFRGEICQQCGLPKYICHSTDPRVQFRVEEESCAAIEAKDDYSSPRRGGKKREIPEGTILRPMPYMTDDSEFVSLREPYYRAEYEKRERIANSR